MRAGDVIWNTLTGEKALLIESAEETGGARLVVDFAVERGGFVPGGEHRHPECSEHFAVAGGQITFVIEGEERTLGPGEELTAPPGSWHRWWNPGQNEVRITTTVEPALRFEEMIPAIWGLCTDGLTNAEGMPSPLIAALLATRYKREIQFREPPPPIQPVMFGSLAALARVLGKQKVLDRYLDLDSHPSAERGRGTLPERVMQPAGS